MTDTGVSGVHKWAGLVLAAGQGTRMKSSFPKVLHQLLGRPLVGYVLSLLDAIGLRRSVVVIGHKAEMVRSYLDSIGMRWVIQEEQLGTGHAVMATRQAMRDFHGNALILCGDTPLLTVETISRFINEHEKTGADLSILSAKMSDPAGYGRIVRFSKEPDRVAAIIEEKDASDEVRAISEINTGIYAVNIDRLYEWLEKVGCDNAQREYYLTDIAGLAVSDGHPVRAFPFASAEEALGVNSRKELAEAEGILLERIRSRWMGEGVTFRIPSTVYIEPEVQLSPDVTIAPHVVLEGKTTVGRGAFVGPFCHLRNASVAPGEIVPPYSRLSG